MFIVSTFCQFVNVNYLLECFFGRVWRYVGGYYYLLECFWGCLDVWMWILCGCYYLLECFWRVSGCLDVDIMWILLFARMFLGGVSGCLDVDKPKWEAGEATCSMLFTVRHVWNENGLFFLFSSPSSSQIITLFTRLQHIYRHKSSVTHEFWKSLILLWSKLGSQAQKWISVWLWWFFCRPAAVTILKPLTFHLAHLNRYTQNFSGVSQKLMWCQQVSCF